MAWADFNTLQDDLVATINAASTGAKLVKKECDERDYSFSNMPLVDVRLSDTDVTVRAGQDYICDVIFEVQVTAYDLSGFNDAATLRQSVLVSVVDAIRAAPKWSSFIESSRIGDHSFSSAKDDNSGAFMAAVTTQVIAQVFADRS